MRLLKQFEEKKPEITFYWKDSKTEAEGWMVINSLRGGAAGGGTRMRKGLQMNEVVSLAKTMEIKFTISGPNIGGAKSGINFDPNDPRKGGVLNRWYKAVRPLLKYYYGTGGDLNVDEVNEVIPITEKYNIWHPQEGVLTGHFSPTEIEKINLISQLREGVSKAIEDSDFSPDPTKNYLIADMITGFGVARAVKHYYIVYKKAYENKRAVIQGWGNVAAAAAYYLAQDGVKIVGIIDKEGGLINEKGYDFNQIKELFLAKKGNKLHSAQMLPFNQINECIWNISAEIFIPAAASRLVLQEQVEQMVKNGLEVISPGANVPFADKEIFYGAIASYIDNKVSVIPDFIANCGIARVFNYLMQKGASLKDEDIFLDTSACIEQAIQEMYDKDSNMVGLSKRAFEIALKKINH